MLAFLGCLLHQSWIVGDDLDPATVSKLSTLVGFYCGVWVVLCQKLLFTRHTALERCFWGGLAAIGLWLLSPATKELEAIVRISLDEIFPDGGRTRDEMDVRFWGLGLVPLLSIWLAHPFFRNLTLQTAQKNEATTPLLAETPTSSSFLWHPWTIRIAILLVATIWLKSSLEVGRLETEASGVWILLAVPVSFLSLLAMVPFYWAITARKRWWGRLLFHVVWLTIPAGLHALAWFYHFQQPFMLPNGPTGITFRVWLPLLSGFAASQLLAFWSSCFFRDRAILYLPSAIVNSLRKSPTSNDERFAEPNNVRPLGWARYGVWTAWASLLFVAILVCSAVLPRYFHVTVWWTADSQAWDRATSVARLQDLQDDDEKVRRGFESRYSYWDRSLMVRRDGVIFCTVSKKMTADPAWTSIRNQIEACFSEVYWQMDFPISDPTDICDSANSVLKIDGQKLRLKDLPQTIYPFAWEVYGGTVDAEDMARITSKLHQIRFDNCFFDGIDFDQIRGPTRQLLTLVDCKFSQSPKSFPANFWVSFELSNIDEFIEKHEWYIQQVYNGGQISIRQDKSSALLAEDVRQRIPEPWRNMVSITSYSNSAEIMFIEPKPLELLFKSASVLPANMNTQTLATDSLGRIIGIDTRIWRDSRTMHSGILTLNHELDWMTLSTISGFETGEADDFSILLRKSWLVEVLDSPGNEFATLAANLAARPSADAGEAFQISNLESGNALDLLPALTNRRILILNCSLWPTRFLATLAKLQQFTRVVVIIDGDTPDPGELANIQQLQTVVKPNIEILPQPTINGDLVRWLKSSQRSESSTPHD